MRMRQLAWFLAAGSFLVGAAVWACRLHLRPPLQVREFRMYGLKALDPAALKSLTGLGKGSPLFGPWMDGVLARVSSNPRVAAATVARSAAGDVVLKVSERAAVALVNLERLYYLSAEGKVLDRARADAPEAFDLPVLTGPWSGGAWSPECAGRVREGLRVLADLSASGVSQKSVSEVHWEESLGWVLYRVGSPARTILGRGEFRERARRWVKVLGRLERERRDVGEIDLDFPDRVVVKLKGTA
jgi:cell division septal protein FtsQ